MAARLRALGWTVTVVDFGMPLPIAHNRIIALNRNWLQAWLNAPGRPAVELLVDYLVEALGGGGGGGLGDIRSLLLLMTGDATAGCRGTQPRHTAVASGE